jgi:CO/xanthine dehydrogenase Mo-binding subunit
VLRGRGYEIVPQLRVAGYRIGFVIHPFGVRGVGEMPIVPPMAAVANAIADATGRRLRDLPMSPPRVLSALGEQGPEPQRLAAE